MVEPKVKPETRQARHRRWRALAAIFVSVIFLTAGDLQYVSYVNAKNDARWCQLFTTLSATYKAQEPTLNAAGLSVEAAINKLRDEFHCNK